MAAEASDMVTVPRAELDALRAEVRRLRREIGRSLAKARIEADPGDGALTLSRSQLAEAWGLSELVPDRLLRRLLAGDRGAPSAVRRLGCRRALGLSGVAGSAHNGFRLRRRH